MGLQNHFFRISGTKNEVFTFKLWKSTSSGPGVRLPPGTSSWPHRFFVICLQMVRWLYPVDGMGYFFSDKAICVERCRYVLTAIFRRYRTARIFAPQRSRKAYLGIHWAFAVNLFALFAAMFFAWKVRLLGVRLCCGALKLIEIGESLILWWIYLRIAWTWNGSIHHWSF